MARSRGMWLRAAAAIVLVATGVLVVTRAAVALAPQATPTCTVGSLGVSFGTTGLDASHVTAYLVFTNRSASTCTLAGSPTVRYVNGRGAPIGNPSRPASSTHPDVVLAAHGTATSFFRSAVPALWSPSACRPVMDAGLRIEPPGTAGSRIVHFPGTVCASRSVHESTASPVRGGPGPTPGSCTATAGQLVTSLGRADHVRAATDVPIVFTDPVLYTCVLWGHPTVRSVHGAAHRPVGPAATPLDAPGPAVWVQPFGGRASATFVALDTRRLPAARCRATRASGVLVTAPGARLPSLLHDAHFVCTRRSSTSVTAITRGGRP
jgi:Protein of unknown function (DUF4232)